MSSTATLPAFERTNFFYGLLMDAERFRKDHAFFNGKRWLLNRLTVGTGVVAGLDVRSDAGPPPRWTLDAGLAIDGAGREVVVTERRAFDPFQPTDDRGQPAGPRLTTGLVQVCLAYRETAVDPVPVLVPDCDHDGECAASTIREGAAIVVRAATAATDPLSCTMPSFPVPPGTGLHEVLAARLRQSSMALPADACVPIARIDLATSAIDLVAGRPLVYSNEVLYELIVCLASHVSAAATRVLGYESGDGQSGPVSTALTDPIVVKLVDALNQPIANEPIAFTVTAGGGSVGAATVKTAADGRASVTWTLGGTPGPQGLAASAKGAVFAVTVRATSV